MCLVALRFLVVDLSRWKFKSLQPAALKTACCCRCAYHLPGVEGDLLAGAEELIRSASGFKDCLRPAVL